MKRCGDSRSNLLETISHGYDITLGYLLVCSGSNISEISETVIASHINQTCIDRSAEKKELLRIN